MQKQKPGQNNPANPLMKAVALVLEKDYEDVDLTKIKILSSLTFKKSSDMVGHTITKDGKAVTVNFSLAIRRASLEMAFESENKMIIRSPVKIRKVTHSKPANLRATLSEVESQKDSQHNAQSLSAKAGAGLIAGGIVPTASLGAGVATSRTQELTSRRSQQKKSIKDGVSATFTNDKVSWDVELVKGLSEHNGCDEYLVGDIFAKKDGTQGVACTATKIETEYPIIITGSVFVRMQDLMIEGVQFTDDDGSETRVRSLSGGSYNPLQTTEDTKITVLKQIVRKHLIDVGMRVEGIRVEVCRANV